MELFSFESLATLAGASLLVYYVTQYTKNIVDKYVNIPTDLYGTCIGAFILALAQFGMGASPLDWKVWVLSICNGFLVQAVAGQTNNSALKYNPDKSVDTTK